MLPVSIVLFDLYFIQGISRSNTIRAAKILIAFMVCALIALFLYLKLDPSTIDYSCRTFGMTERLLTQPRVLFYYLSLLLYPLNSRLMLVHDFDISTSLFDPWTTCIALAALVLILGITLFAAKKIPLISYCILFFFINHLIEGSFFSLELIYEHRNYLPSIFLPLPIAIGLLNMLDFFEKKKIVFISLATAIPSMMIVFGITTFMYNDIFRNDLTLWYDNAQKTPRLQIPHHNLGLAYLEAGRLPEAYDECLKALQSAHTGNITNKYRTYIVLMQYYIALGDMTKSLYYADIALHYFPNIAELYYVKGIILLERKGPDEAEIALKKAIALKPNDARFYCSLGTILLKKADYDGAISQAQYALRLTPESWQVYALLADATNKKGHHWAAVHFSQIKHKLYREQSFLSSAL
jgi:tetratricopeptide (TPR) repeat protein